MLARLALLIVFFAGLLFAAQGAINAELGRQLGNPIQAALVSFLLGTVVLATVLLLWPGAGLPSMRQLAGISPVWLLGGVMGAIFVTTFIIFVPRVGVLNVLLLALAGQLIGSMLIDHYGWLNVPQQPIDRWRIAGVALVCLGVTLLNRRHFG